ncbi:ankyrin repeat domain-containing protein [Sphingobacterium daejeonense]|jgi:ankyrin repeat protein|uniref:ankyrin repeat domain-containing protein n=1 Tax=Sphingobacterium daejeonense TaxID=371142 RepID=UPI0021A77DB5|nr:ankyrin repeat domain-containing protein [Sphingobacterium daejeonense]MCT1531622.1 ankyrin repeat domain-containing protein [Sphingobacterium daejeonense]
MSLTVLEEYIETGNHQDLDLLLSQNPDLVKENTSHDISPLLLACYYHKNQIIQVILKYIKSITIHEACAAGLTEQVQFMVDQKPDVINELSSHGFYPLGIAAHFGKEDIVRILLRNRANPNSSSQNGYQVFPIHSALSNGQDNIAKMLIEAGAEVNVLQSSRISPLHLAAQQGNVDLIIILLEHGANIAIKNDFGQTASDLAAEKGYNEIAEILKA